MLCYPAAGKGAAPTSVGTTDPLVEEVLRLLILASIFSSRGRQHLQVSKDVRNWLSFMNASKKRENTSEKTALKINVLSHPPSQVSHTPFHVSGISFEAIVM